MPDHGRVVEPGPVAPVGDRFRSRMGERRRTRRRSRRQPRVAFAPDDQGRCVQSGQSGAGGGEIRLRGGAVKPEDGALGALVEVFPHLGDLLVAPGLRPRARGAELAGEQPAVGRAHHELADHGSSPQPGRPVPGEPVEQRQRVDQDEPLDPLGMALGEREADGGAPVMRDQPDAVQVLVRRGSARRNRPPRSSE